MSETRALPKAAPRSTGIQKTTTAVSRPVNGATGSNAFTASPSAGRAAHDRVRAEQGRQINVPQNGAPRGAPPDLLAHAKARQQAQRSGAPNAMQARTFNPPQFTEQETSLAAMILVDAIKDPRMGREVGPIFGPIIRGMLDKIGDAMGCYIATSDVAPDDKIGGTSTPPPPGVLVTSEPVTSEPDDKL